MRKQASLFLSSCLALSLSVSLFLDISTLRKSFSSGNSTAREMKFMNSNAFKTFSFVKGRKRIRETLNSVMSAGFIGRGEPITLPERSEKVKFVTEVRQYYAR